MHEGFVSFGSSSIHYSCRGTGNKLLLCFHGYGESAASFACLEETLGKDFTILALDLPFHGKTEWKDGLYFDPKQLPPLIDKIVANLPARQDSLPQEPSLREHAPHEPAAPDRPVLSEPWWVLGYSMGGRVALSLFEMIPEKIARLVLLAPDGLKVNGWYWLATQWRPGNRVFRWAMQRPAFFFFILRMAQKMKWVNAGIYKFIFWHIDDARVRDELYKRWTVMRGFKPDIPAIRSIIREKGTQIRLLYGRHDRIILARTGERFRKGIEAWCSLTILDTGHALLQPRQADSIAALLKD